MSVMEVNTANFTDEVLNSPVPVCVDFWAEWCMPCRLIAPTIDELSAEYGGRVKFVKVNVDASPELATQMQIMSIPHLVFFNAGKPAFQITGVNSKPFIKDKIEEVIESNR